MCKNSISYRALYIDDDKIVSLISTCIRKQIFIHLNKLVHIYEYTPANTFKYTHPGILALGGLMFGATTLV